jgi:EAL domain-containing protein (putative c-di-GMP-specific phosphodiesterase class I)
MAVNLSVRVLHDQGLPALVASLLKRFGVRPQRLTVEITESMLLAEPHHAVKILAALAELGVRISIDDFGTGYSSLGNLTRLPVHEIKIDKSFVIGMDASMAHKEQAMVQSMIAMSRALSLDVVAEGVENTQVWHQLHVLGCTMAQGYYLSRPLPPQMLESWALSQGCRDASA